MCFIMYKFAHYLDLNMQNINFYGVKNKIKGDA